MRNGIITRVLTHPSTSYHDQTNKFRTPKRKLDLVYSKVLGYFGKNEKRIKLQTRKSRIIFHLGDVFPNSTFQVRMGRLVGRAANSELKICVPAVSQMLVAVWGQHWWWMAAGEAWERDVLLFSPESRD